MTAYFVGTNRPIIRAGSLFSGIGGLDLGLERAGIEIRWQCEIDPFCREVLAQHWPSVPCYDDVRNLPDDIEPVDLICGGYPCQPYANNGHRKGSDDERDLWPEFFRVIRLLRPSLVLAENVPGHLSLGFDRTLADLAGLGFDVEWSVVSACSVGAPHTRERLYWVAYPEGSRRHRVWDETPASPLRGAGHVDREPQGPGAASHWAAVPTPEPLGMAHGVRTEVDRARLKAHGNAVVPQVAELIGRRLMEAA